MFLANFSYRVFFTKGRLLSMDNNNSMVRLRQLGIAFLLATLVIGVFSYMGIRGTRRNEILNEHFRGAFSASRELLLTLNHVEFQITMLGIEYKNNGFTSEASLERCRILVELIDDRFEILANEAEAHLSVYDHYYEFFPLMHQLALQVAVLEMEASQTVVDSAMETIADLARIVSDLNQKLEQLMEEQAESDSQLQSVSLGLIATITLLVIGFALPLILLPIKPRPKKPRRDNLYQFPNGDHCHRKKTHSRK